MNRNIFSHFALSLLLVGCSGRIIPSGGAVASTPPPVTEGSQAKAPPAVTDNPARPSHDDKAQQPIASTPAATLPAPAPDTDISTAAGLGIVRGPAIGGMGLSEVKAKAALVAFGTSCPGLLKRNDISGLTLNTEWVAACEGVKSWQGDAVSFFATYMDAVQVGDGKAFATGYYEPEIEGTRTRKPGYDVPIYGRPSDLIDVDLSLWGEEYKGKKVRGKIKGNALVLYDDRTAIEEGALDGKATVIAWAKDPVEFFFLQVQGSGRLRSPDGTIMKIGYASQNGRDYTGIGRVMKERNLNPAGDYSMQGIVAWLNANPEAGKQMMRENKSFVFFQELKDTGALGAMGYPVVAETSVAADPKFIPLGAPIWISMDRAEPNGIWVAQDTGGAIKGSNRFDTFWGAGDKARALAGGMAARGAALIFLPKQSVTRLVK